MSNVNRRTFLKTAACGISAGVLLKSAAKAAPAEAPKAKPWSLVILPDTQKYARDYPGLFHMQTQWIVENKDRLNIAYVLQNGDVTDNNVPLQWQRAAQAFSRLDGKVPYAIALGNHDCGANGRTQDRTTLAADYIPLSRFERMPTFGGAMEPGKIDNTWHRFTAGGRNYLILCFEFGPRDSVLEWANGIVSSHPDHKVIVVTHAYLYSDSTRYDWKTKGKSQTWNPHSYAIAATGLTTINDGQEMWDKLVKRHPNMFMVINGHVLNDGLGYLVSQGDAGNNVYQMLVNFQMLPLGGEGWLRILTFNPEAKTIDVADYSPLYDNFKTGDDNRFTINLSE